MHEVYTIADIVEWLDKKIMVPNPDFQRRYVWPAAAKTYFIDTILRERPVPTVYFRSQVDLKTKRTYREVVDGQQRLRTIHDFANNVLTLGPRAAEFNGMKYQDLPEDKQQGFLAYQISAFQLINANDDVVVDVFKRLNAYGLSVNPQELRHGKYSGDFKWAIEETAKKWSILWDKYKVVSLRSRVRMADDELIAQIFGVILDGVVDGGQPSIERLYKTYDPGFPAETVGKVNTVLEYMINNLDTILETSLSRSPQFLILFAAVAHALIGIPVGNMGQDMPDRDPLALSDMDTAINNLGTLSGVLDADESEIPERFNSFKLASAGTTQRIKSRSIRFKYLYKALLPQPI